MTRKILAFLFAFLLFSVCFLAIGEAEKEITIGLKEKVSLGDLFGSRVQSAVSENDCVTADLKKQLLSGNGIGETLLTLVLEDGTEETCRVTVLAAPKNVSFTLERDVYGVGEQFAPTIETDGESGFFSVEYASKNKNILVFQNGVFKALQEGSGKITAKLYNGKNVTKGITVVSAPKSVSFDSEEYRIGLGDTVPLHCTVNKGSGGAITYSSNNEAVAAVDSHTGRVQALCAGSAVITAETYNGLKTECTVQVCDIPEEVHVTLVGNVLARGETAKPLIAFYPEDAAASCTLHISSASPADCVIVNEDGTITGVRAGSATLTVETHNGLQAQATFTVCNPPASVQLQPVQMTLPIGCEEALQPVFPENSGCQCVFSSSRPEVANVDSSGNVTALSEGVAVITAATFNGKKASMTVTVPNRPDTINLCETMDMFIGETTLLAWSFPENSSSPVLIESSDPAIVSVDENGKLEACKTGTAELTVRALNSQVNASCKVTVHELPEQFRLLETEYELCVGEKLVPSLQLVPDDSRTGLSYVSEEDGILRIEEESVYGNQPGTTSLLIKTSNGLEATAAVTVLPAPDALSVSQDIFQMQAGTRQELGANYTEGTFTHIHYTSSDDSVAIVLDGQIQALSAGTAVITVETDNGLSERCLVNVTSSEPSDIVSGDTFSATFLNIGRNDGILLSCNGEYAFLDSGVERFGIQAAEYMSSLGIDHLKYYIGTHGHKDHIGGASAIFSAIKTDWVLVPHEKVIEQIHEFCYTEAEKEAAEQVKYLIFRHGESLCLGKAKITCLGPVHVVDIDPKRNDENYNSLVLRIDFGNTSYLLCADSMYNELADTEALYPGMMNCDVLKTPHHYSEQPQEFIDWTTPLITVFSTDNENKPKAEYSRTLTAMGCTVLCTAPNRDGTIVISSDGEKLTIATENGTTAEILK